MTVGTALKAFNSRAHHTLSDESGRAIMIDDRAETAPEGIEILAFCVKDFETMAFQGLTNVVTLEVVTGVTGNGDVIVIDQQFDIQLLSDGESSCFSIIPLLLRAVRAQAKDGLVSVGERNTVDKGPCRDPKGVEA